MEKNNFRINIIYCILNIDERVFFFFFLTKFSIIKNIQQVYSNFYFILNKNSYLSLIIINKYYQKCCKKFKFI